MEKMSLKNDRTKEEQQSLPVSMWLKRKNDEAQLALQLTLPFCSPVQRQVPNEIVRSALFTCCNRNTAREQLKNTQIAVIGDGNIVYRGEELRQDDEVVWMHLLYLARKANLGEALTFVPHGFLHDIHWPTNGAGYTHLRASLDRMKATALTISSSRLGRIVSVSLIRKIEYSTLLGEQKIPLRTWRVWIETEMRILFDPDYLTRVDFQMYLTLRSGIARKLFLYWSSHRSPYPVKTETLMELCHSRTTRKEFRRLLPDHLQDLVAVGFLEYWNFSDGLWSVKRRKIIGDDGGS